MDCKGASRPLNELRPRAKSAISRSWIYSSKFRGDKVRHGDYIEDFLFSAYGSCVMIVISCLQPGIAPQQLPAPVRFPVPAPAPVPQPPASRGIGSVGLMLGEVCATLLLFRDVDSYLSNGKGLLNGWRASSFGNRANAKTASRESIFKSRVFFQVLTY